jgi:predicted Zn-dependent protease
MYKVFLPFLLSLLLVSCASVQSIKPNEKAFEQEDVYVLFALRAEQLNDYNSASILFNTLYEKSSKKEYLYRSLENDLVAKENEKLIARVDVFAGDSLADPKLIRLKIVALLELQRFEESQNLAVALVHQTQESDDYLLVSETYSKNREYDIALKYLDSAYVKEYNEKILDQMSIILYVNLDRKKDAIAYLETHMRVHGSSKLICNRLLGIYSNENNIDGLLSTYKRLYAIDQDFEVAKKIIGIYTYKRDYIHLTDFLEESGSDDEALLELYSAAKNYKKAYPLANDLYKKTSDISYLGQSAIYEYESAKDKKSKTLLSSVVTKLTKVAKESSEPLYKNYLGYILIDHEIDVKKGISYIQQVLKLQPESAYYIDSLAWGYFKLGECEKAKKLMSKVVKLEGGDDPEVLLHVKQIDKCIKIKKGKI